MSRKPIDENNPNTFVICQLCGLKARTVSHAHLSFAHSISLEEYKKTYPNSPTRSVNSQKKRSELSKTICIKALEKALGGKDGMRDQVAKARENIVRTPEKNAAWNKLMVEKKKTFPKGYFSESAQRGAANRYSDPKEKARARENMLLAQKIGAEQKAINWPQKYCKWCKNPLSEEQNSKQYDFCSVSHKMKWWYQNADETKKQIVTNNLSMYTGRFVPVHYKGITYQSKTEVKFAKILERMNIAFEYHSKRVPYQFDNGTHYYHIDFYLPVFDLYVEVKSRYYWEENLDKNLAKMNAVLSRGMKIILILEKEIDRIEKQKLPTNIEEINHSLQSANLLTLYF
jgi:hypothetical protein